MALDFLTKEKLRTGFGEVITASDYDEVLVQAGLNWNVNTHPLFTEVNGVKVEIPKTNAVVRSEDQKPLGIVSDKYKLVNNSDAFAFTESILNTGDIQFVRGGSYRGGSSTWLEAKVTGQYSILGDDVDCYLVFVNSHDGTGSVKCMIVPERIACSNVLNLPLKGQSRFWRCVHSGDPFKKIDEARQVLLAGSSYMEALNKECERLSAIKITDLTVMDLIARLFKIDDDMTDKQKENINIRRSQLADVFYQKDDLSDFGHTAYKFVSAVADYADHVEGRKTATAAINRYMGVVHGNPLVDQAYTMVLTL